MRNVMAIVYRVALNALGLGLAVLLFRHAEASSFGTLVLAALVLSICNFFVKPVLTFIAIPFMILTLGLFYIVISGVVILITSALVPGFLVDGLWTAIGMSLVVAFVNFIFDLFYSNSAVKA